VRELHEICRDTGVPDCHTFILGTRGETLDDVRRTLDFVADLDPWSAILLAWVDDTEALDPALRRERMALREGVLAALAERKDEFPHWVIPPLGVNFDKGVFRRLRRDGFHGPLWQYIRPAAGPGRSPGAVSAG
jgi:hypothetical protein